MHDAQVRYQAGAAAHYDVLRAQLDVDSAQRQETTADADIKIAREALVQAMGLTEGDYAAVEVEPPILNIAPVEEFVKKAYANRPELRALNMQINAACEAIKAAQAQRLPTRHAERQLCLRGAGITRTGVRVDGRIRRIAPDLGLRIDPRTGRGSAAGSIHRRLPRAMRCASKSARKCAMPMHGTRQPPPISGVAREQVEVAQEAYRIAEVRFRAGVGTATENADAQSALLSARQGLVQAQANLGISLGRIGICRG